MRAVVFDLDGVLVDSIRVACAAFAHAYAAVVGPGEPPFDEYCRYLGWLFADIMRAMGLPPEMEAPFVAESARRSGEVEVFAGVPAMLERLGAQGLGIGVATGKTGDRARRLLDATGLSARIDTVVGGDEVPRAKPAPDIMHAVLHRLGAAPEAAVAVGDAPADIESARAAGVRAVAATWNGRPTTSLLDARPDEVAASPDDVVVLCGVG